DIDAAVRRYHRDGHERLIKASRDHHGLGPAVAAVVGDRAVDPRREGHALLAKPEVAISDDGVAVPPRRDVLLVQEVADAGLDTAARGDPHHVPGLAAVARVGD